MRRLCLVWASLGLVYPAGAQVVIDFDSNSFVWNLSNGVTQAGFQLGPDGRFGLKQITNIKSETVWRAAGSSSPVRLQLDSNVYSADTPFRFAGQSMEDAAAGGRDTGSHLDWLGGGAR